MPTAGVLIDRLRLQDEHNLGVVTLLAHDPMLAKLIAAWPTVARRLAPDENPSEPSPEGLPASEHERWLWSRVEPEPEPLWAEAAGLPDAPHVRRAMRVLMDNCAVFPDGTMSTWSDRFLRESAKRAGVRLGDDAEDAA
jgi:hypothetical protein